MNINFVVQHQQGCHGTGHLDAHFPRQGIEIKRKRFNFVGNYQFWKGGGTFQQWHEGITPGIIARCDIAVWTALVKYFCSS